MLRMGRMANSHSSWSSFPFYEVQGQCHLRYLDHEPESFSFIFPTLLSLARPNLLTAAMHSSIIATSFTPISFCSSNYLPD